MTHATRLTAIVPVHNGAATLAACLRALRDAEAPPDEILVADDGSTDGGAAIAREFGARVLSLPPGSPPRGPGDARNRAAVAASGDLLLFVDADVAVHGDAVRRVRAAFAAEPDLAALLGSYDDDPPVRSAPSLYKNLLHHWTHQHARRDAWTFWSGCGAVRRADFLAVGGFDAGRYPRPSVEDIELGARLRASGRRIALVPEIQATHLKAWTLVGLIRTDIFGRAVPWTLLLREAGGALPSDLNLDWRSRAGALAALLAASSPLAALLRGSPAPLLGVPTGVLAVVLLNLRLFGFLRRCGGAGFAAVAALLHTLYLLYSAVTFVVVSVLHRAGLLRPEGPFHAPRVRPGGPT